MGKPRFSLRTLFAATAAVGALLASAAIKNPVAASLIAVASATILPAALLTGIVRGRGYVRTFCSAALIPAGLMCAFVADQTAKAMIPISNADYTGMLYITTLGRDLHFRVRHVVFAFGLASLVAGLTGVATHWLLARISEKGPTADEAD